MWLDKKMVMFDFWSILLQQKLGKLQRKQYDHGIANLQPVVVALMHTVCC